MVKAVATKICSGGIPNSLDANQNSGKRPAVLAKIAIATIRIAGQRDDQQSAGQNGYFLVIVQRFEVLPADGEQLDRLDEVI